MRLLSRLRRRRVEVIGGVSSVLSSVLLSFKSLSINSTSVGCAGVGGADVGGFYCLVIGVAVGADSLAPATTYSPG